jgi:hypothetical protein
MEGDLELARLEIDDGISVPRRALDHLIRERGIDPDDVEFRTRFAAMAALQLGWVALEEFLILLADLGEVDREEVRERVRGLIGSLVPESSAGSI